jgi:hypothetical protein
LSGDLNEKTMDTRTPVHVVHCFDTHSRRILCEPSGSDFRSTKHAHRVTCAACLELLAARRARAEGADPVSHSAL